MDRFKEGKRAVKGADAGERWTEQKIHCRDGTLDIFTAAKCPIHEFFPTRIARWVMISAARPK